MNRQVALVLVFSAFAVLPVVAALNAAEAQDAVVGSIGVTLPNKKVIKIDFTKQDLTRLSIKLVKQRLVDAAGESASCPEERKKIGDGTWLCGDGTVISTKNRTLATFLDLIFQKRL